MIYSKIWLHLNRSRFDFVLIIKAKMTVYMHIINPFILCNAYRNNRNYVTWYLDFSCCCLIALWKVNVVLASFLSRLKICTVDFIIMTSFFNELLLLLFISSLNLLIFEHSNHYFKIVDFLFVFIIYLVSLILREDNYNELKNRVDILQNVKRRILLFVNFCKQLLYYYWNPRI